MFIVEVLLLLHTILYSYEITRAKARSAEQKCRGTARRDATRRLCAPTSRGGCAHARDRDISIARASIYRYIYIYIYGRFSRVALKIDLSVEKNHDCTVSYCLCFLLTRSCSTKLPLGLLSLTSPAQSMLLYLFSLVVAITCFFFRVRGYLSEH